MSYSGQQSSGTQPTGLPARPTGPLPSFDNRNGASGGNAAASLFRPRAVGGGGAGGGGWSSQQQSYPGATVSAAPTANPNGGYGQYSSAATASYASQPSMNYDAQAQQQYGQYYTSGLSVGSQSYGTTASPAAPQIKNPFAPPPVAGAVTNGYSAPQVLDPDYEAQMAQWQSAYMNKDASDSKTTTVTGGNANLTPLGQRPNIGPSLTDREIAAAAPSGSKAAAVVQGADGKQATVVRAGGGKTWTDDSLLEWDPANPRLFIGNLAGEVTDDSLYKAFSKYGSIVKTKVVRDRRTTKSKGYGFVSFRDADDYLKAFKEMQGKYIGSHPVLIKKSNTEIKAVDPKKQHGKGGKWDKNKKGRDVTGANTGAGVKKGQEKTRNGMVLLG